ncbi:HEAT repeat protein [Aspergillus steynii IBT 23096]|uniref:HEAT repeat protein n=1 Tax=Aspergillus steynii IBT 23096 TaxID=1392250 RepID=A0A2I2GSR1_9EURO|nr:HEAT repeat protein [Aspergillus steynii IBT 23096]PLB55905.1 HEAT repeat protein [Aspergillus steynii IBT 23096]
MGKEMASEAMSGAPGDAGSLQMDAIAQCIQVVPEKTMLEISKGPLGRFMQSCEDIQQVSRVWQSLLKTFATASISHGHTSVSCNTVSAFLDAARISKCEATRQLVLSRETWMSVFEVFLVRFKDGKPKPMKQLLESLVALLTKHLAEHDRQFIKSQIIDATLPSIVLNERRSQLKACLVTLEILVRKNALPPVELTTMVRSWLRENAGRWIPLFQEDCKALAIDVTQFLEKTSDDGPATLESQRPAAEVFVLALVAQARSFELAAGPGDTMTAFFQKVKALPPTSHSREHVQGLLSVWVAPVRHVILQNMHLLEPMSSYFLHPLFSIDPIGFRGFLNQLPFENLLTGDMHDAPVDELSLLFASLQMAKKIGLVHEDHTSPKGPTAKGGAADEGIILKSEVIGQFLFHRDFSIRIAALSLLITANATTKPFTSATMRAILKGLPSLHAESDAYSRGEILSIIRKLIPRLKGGIMSSEQNWAEVMASANKKQPPNYARDDPETRACLTEYLEFLKADLQPTASYQRHITSLKTLILLLESGLDARFEGSIVSKSEGNLTKWRFNTEVFEPNLLRLLVDLLLDPFEEVRARSLSIVNLFPRDLLLGDGVQLASNASDQAQLLGALDTAEQMASRTSRADYADTVARLYHILFCAAQSSSIDASQWWETKIGVVDAILKRLEAKLSLSGAIVKYHLRDAPLHGHVSALRYIVSTTDFHALISGPESPNYENWRSTHARIVSICDKIWNEVKPVLCIDSPEGHSDEPAEGLSVGPKDILSYSWRALRESSLLLHATLVNSTYGPQGSSGLTYDDYQKIGTTSFTQLAELRHRGAFSTVSQTFATCCLRCGQSSDPEVADLPTRWYQDARKIIFEAASKLTRRSAGLPALITGIVSAKPGGPLFRKVVDDLHEISHLPAAHSDKQDLELPQVHAMNCLKDIFTNTKFGAFTEAFIMPALTLSAERIGSPIWALRNCGLMLFRALLTRICRTGTGLGFGGKSGSEPGARVSFQKYPGLIQLLSTLLTEEDTRNIAAQDDHSIVTERVFPALELIAEKVPNVYDVDDRMILGLVKTQLSSPVWGIREHAARVYASILNRSDIIKEVRSLIDDDAQSKAQDLLHGKALCVKYALRRFALVSNSLWNEHADELSSFIKHFFAMVFTLAESPFVATTLVEVLTETVVKSLDSGSETILFATLNDIFDAHSFDDILDFIFDSTHPSWKSLSTTRAASLLRRALSWAAVLRRLGTDESNELETFILKVSCFDANAGAWLLEQVQETFGENTGKRNTLLRLYSVVILGDYPGDVKSSAIASLASSLETVLDFSRDNFHGIELPWDALDRQINLGSDAPIWNRDRSDAELRLQGCLLAAKVISNQSGSLQEDVSRWTIKLRFAMQEETEFTTRHAAVASITAFGRVLRSPGKAPVAEGFFLEPYLILYDMLNDDDEELRDLAALTASWVLSYSSVTSSKAVTLSPFNASHLLSEFIVDNYSGSPTLCARVIRYITGQETRIGGSTQRKRLSSVSDLISEHRQESTTLFEEEKQNLFVDEVREVERWSGQLLRLTKGSYDDRLTVSVSQWVSDGLSYLIELAVDGAGSGKDGFIGWTSKPETFTLGVRLINLAAVMASPGFPASRSLGGEGPTLKEKLQLLYMHGKAVSLHVDWLSRIRRAVDAS